MGEEVYQIRYRHFCHCRGCLLPLLITTPLANQKQEIQSVQGSLADSSAQNSLLRFDKLVAAGVDHSSTVTAAARNGDRSTDVRTLLMASDNMVVAETVTDE